MLFGIATLFFAVGVFAAWYKSAKALEEIEVAKPVIKLRLPGATESVTVSQNFDAKTDDGQDALISVTVPFLRVRFWNDPPSPYPKAIARGLRAYVKFFPIGQSVSTVEISGRWSESTQPDTKKPLESISPLAETTLGLGETKTVDVAYISGLDGKCYAWNNENYRHPVFQNPQHLLSGQGYSVCIRIRGEWVDKSFQFTFYVDNGKFRFTQPIDVIQ